MATAAQIAANRRNALRSTGPKSAAGKARSRKNAASHRLTAEPEPEDVLAHLRKLIGEPETTIEECMQTSVGLAAIELAEAEARLDRVRKTVARGFRDDPHEALIQPIEALLPLVRGRSDDAKITRAVARFLISCERKASKAWRGSPASERRYYASAHAERRRALIRFLQVSEQNNETSPIST
jgi:hypothetical protein